MRCEYLCKALFSTTHLSNINIFYCKDCVKLTLLSCIILLYYPNYEWFHRRYKITIKDDIKPNIILHNLFKMTALLHRSYTILYFNSGFEVWAYLTWADTSWAELHSVREIIEMLEKEFPLHVLLRQNCNVYSYSWDVS